MKHTKSPSGKTHRLQNGKGHETTLRYMIRPEFDDQVQGDLIRKYRAETGDPTPIGILPVYVDAALLDTGQQQPSLDYLRGYLEGLEGVRGNASRKDAIRNTREQIAVLEAAQTGISPVTQERPQTDRDRHRTQGYRSQGRSALDAGVRRVREAEDRGW